MKPKIYIAPYAKPLKNGNDNPKNYPYWASVVDGLCEEYDMVQLVFTGERIIHKTTVFEYTKLTAVEEVLHDCVAWISVDNFLPHMVYNNKGVKGVVIWGKSDPLLFGYPEYVNLLKDRKNLRAKQFYIWDDERYDPNVFVKPAKVVEAVKKILK